MAEVDLSFDDSDDLIDDFDDDTDFRLVLESDLANVCNTYVKFSDLNIKSLLQFESRPIVSLTEEEREVINKCTDDKLTRLLILNRAHYSQVRELKKQLQHILIQCNKCIAKGKESVEEIKLDQHITSQNIIKSDIWRTAAPYFKDAQFYGAPLNDDVIKKQKNGELCLLVVNQGRRWTVPDKRAFVKDITLQYFNYCHNGLKKKLSINKIQLKHAKGNEKKEKEILSEISSLNKEIKYLKPSVPPLGTVEGIDWLTISCVALKGRHPVIECIAFWNMILHPELNTGEWSSKEEEDLKEIVAKNKFQNWDKISEELGTKRSPFLVAKHYLSHLASKFNTERFTPEEDEYILEVVENVRLGSYIPWGKVAYYFENRSKYQLYHRYRYYLSYNNIKKGQFTEAEDAMLIFLVKKYGKHFNKVAKHFPNRTPVQLRNRYGNYLNKNTIKVGNYSHEDDAKILEHVDKYGDKNWGNLAVALQRTRAHVRQRHISLKRWISKHPNLDITQMPRRNSTSIVQTYSNRNKRTTEILEQLHASTDIPRLDSLEPPSKTPMKLSISKKNSKKDFSAIDKEIINFFRGTCKFQKEPVQINVDMHKESARRIIQFMDVFCEDINYLKPTNENDHLMHSKMSTTLTYIKQMLETEISGKPTFSVFSSNSDLSNNEGKNIKCFIPPTIRSLLGLRGLIIKFNMYKDEYKQKVDSQEKISNALSWKLELALQKCHSTPRLILENQRNLFFRRLYSVFRWPIILSYQFPTVNACNSN